MFDSLREEMTDVEVHFTNVVNAARIGLAEREDALWHIGRKGKSLKSDQVYCRF